MLAAALLIALLRFGAAADSSAADSYAFWSSDFHISPIHDLTLLFRDLGMRVADESLSGHCHLTGTCAKGLKVLNKQNGINLGPCPNALRRQFFQAYKADARMRAIDAFVCQHAAALCEVFMPFGKPLIVIASTRYEIGRHDPARWQRWNANLRRIAADPRNVVAANNLYDAKYVEYFTGLSVEVIPNWCGYASFPPQPRLRSKHVIIAPGGRSPPKELHRRLKGMPGPFKFSTISELYPGRFEYAQLAQHPAILLIPYQVSVMSLFEYYRMNVPIFAPSPELLVNWHKKFNLLKERTWFGVYNRPRRSSPLPKHPDATDELFRHDPNNDVDREAMAKWLQLSDFYQWPHITIFHSLDDAVQKLQSADLDGISRLMEVENARVKASILDQWQGIFQRMFAAPAAPVDLGYDAAMRAHYGVSVSQDCHGERDVASRRLTDAGNGTAAVYTAPGAAAGNATPKRIFSRGFNGSEYTREPLLSRAQSDGRADAKRARR
ncbi:hypothetical protein M885DRAFT_621165 [Pelagophyceae sp. CCMP2097]|nr:hypothetical protein M885DRAFT_621165 [Pelagophyceae sp. CCMP2097]